MPMVDRKVLRYIVISLKSNWCFHLFLLSTTETIFTYFLKKKNIRVMFNFESPAGSSNLTMQGSFNIY